MAAIRAELRPLQIFEGGSHWSSCTLQCMRVQDTTKDFPAHHTAIAHLRVQYCSTKLWTESRSKFGIVQKACTKARHSIETSVLSSPRCTLAPLRRRYNKVRPSWRAHGEILNLPAPIYCRESGGEGATSAGAKTIYSRAIWWRFIAVWACRGHCYYGTVIPWGYRH